MLKQITTTAAQLMSVLKRPRWKLPLQNVLRPRVTLKAIGMPASIPGGPEAVAMLQPICQLWTSRHLMLRGRQHMQQTGCCKERQYNTVTASNSAAPTGQ